MEICCPDAACTPACTRRLTVSHLNRRCYTYAMPTTRRRHAVTETDRVAHALAAAGQRWPEDADRPSRLLARLIELAAERLDEEAGSAQQLRIDVLRRVSGAYTGLYEPGYLQELREEWGE